MAEEEDKNQEEKQIEETAAPSQPVEEFTGEIIETKFGKIKPIRIVDEMKKSYLDYAMSVIVSRALPDVRDGLKPVHRRILYAMKGLGLSYNTKHKKSARIVGEVLGKYHPHGDTAVYDAMVRLAQDFSMRYPLVDGQGNFGSVDGDSPAAMRYTEAKMAKITGELLEDLEKDTVDWSDNFDGTFREPDVMPAKLPNLLLMGGDGIAVGMATKIPPHNLREIVDAISKLIELGKAKLTTEIKDDELENLDYAVLAGSFESEATIDDLMEHVSGPDFPTGGTIYDIEEIRKIYTTGKGRVVTRAEANIEETKTGRFQIIVTEIPYQVNKAKLITKIAHLVRNKKLTDISDLRDESDRDGMRIVIELKRTAKPKAVLNNLFKFTDLQASFPANMVALDGEGAPHLMTLKQILIYYVRHRQTVVVRRSQYELKSSRARIHILEGFIKALENLDAVIETIKKSKDADNAKVNLIQKFDFSDIQAVAILDMQLRKLSALERQKIEDEYKELMKIIDKLTSLLKSPAKILRVIVKEIEELKEKYGDDRRSKVVKSKLGEFSEEDFVGKEENLITITKAGYIKRMPLDTYRSQRRGGKGVMGMTTKEEDEILHMTIGNTHDYILFFTDRGKVYSLRVFELPEGVRQAKGQAVVNLINVEQEEKVEAVITISKEQFKQEKSFIAIATRNGIIKKTALKQYESIRASGKIGINMRKDDQLINAQITNGEQYVMLVTHLGKSIKFAEKEVKPTGRDTMGVKGISLKKDDYIITMDTFEKETSTPKDKRRKFFREILVVTEHGLGKRTNVDEYPSQKRGGQGVKVGEVTKKTGNIAGALLVREDVEQIVLTTKAAQVIKLPLRNIKVLGRSTQGVILMRPKKGDLITSVTAIKSSIEEE